MPTQNSTQTYEMLKTYLDETADSFEKLDEEPGFLYRKTDGRTSLVFCARVDKELGFLLLSAYPGILVRTSYVPMIADDCRLLPAHHAGGRRRVCRIQFVRGLLPHGGRL